MSEEMEDIWVIYKDRTTYVNPPVTLMIEKGQISCVKKSYLEEKKGILRTLTDDEIAIITGARQLRGSMIKPEWVAGDVVESEPEPEAVEEVVVHEVDGLDDMNKRALLEYASDHDIEGVKRIMKVDDIRALIKKSIKAN